MQPGSTSGALTNAGSAAALQEEPTGTDSSNAARRRPRRLGPAPQVDEGMSHIAQTAVAAREASRHETGRFGEKPHTDPGVVELDPTPASPVQYALETPLDAFYVEDPDVVYLWAKYAAAGQSAL